MDRTFEKAPCPDPDLARDMAAVAAMPVPSDRLYQIAALTFVVFLLATIF